MSATNDYTKRELDLKFARLEEILTDIRTLLEENTSRVDKEISEIRKEVQALKDWQNRLMTIWAAIVLVLGVVGQHIIKLFTTS